jgi:hypothetical protein
VKGKQANGVDSQYSSTLPRNTFYPALLPTIRTYDKLPSSVVSCELSSRIRQFQNHCFRITLIVERVSSVVSSIMIYLSITTGLTPGGSSTVHIYTQTIHTTTQTT